MADIELEQNHSLPLPTKTLYKDMGDGTHARGVFVRGSPDEPVPVANVPGSTTLSVGIADQNEVSDVIDMRQYTRVIVHVPDEWTPANLAVQTASSLGTTNYFPLYDENGGLVRCNGGANVVPNASYAVPSAVSGCRYIKLWSEDGTGGSVPQNGNRTLVVDLKT
jgi:hypothetical protein